MSDQQPQSRVRLLKVLVQPIYVLDDGADLTELPAQPLEIKAGAWRDFATSAFTPEALARVAEQVSQHEA
jgi:hypothetical protein